MHMDIPVWTFGHWRPHKRRHLPAHRNDGLEVVVVTRGRFTWMVDGRSETLGPGSAFFTLPWQEHGAPGGAMPGCALSYVVLPLRGSTALPPARLRFHPGLGLGLGRSEETAVFSALVASSRHAVPAPPRLAATLTHLVDELAGAAPDRRAQVAALATTVVLDLARAVRVEASDTSASAGAAARVRAFLATLAETCDRPWTLAGMARRCGLGRTRFADLVERETGDSPITHVLRLRVRRMETLLRGGRSVTAAALACGFSSSQYAARVFRAFTGRAPREVRG